MLSATPCLSKPLTPAVDPSSSQHFTLSSMAFACEKVGESSSGTLSMPALDSHGWPDFTDIGQEISHPLVGTPSEEDLDKWEGKESSGCLNEQQRGSQKHCGTIRCVSQCLEGEMSLFVMLSSQTEA
ncbi:UNVERIFIED_CONTAM: hypothetical protein K2H54_047972 [Gekko kuhli]